MLSFRLIQSGRLKRIHWIRSTWFFLQIFGEPHAIQQLRPLARPWRPIRSLFGRCPQGRELRMFFQPLPLIERCGALPNASSFLHICTAALPPRLAVNRHIFSPGRQTHFRGVSSAPASRLPRVPLRRCLMPHASAVPTKLQAALGPLHAFTALPRVPFFPGCGPQ